MSSSSTKFRRYSRSLAALAEAPEVREAALKHNFEGIEELIVQVGSGKMTPQGVVVAVFRPRSPGVSRKEAEAPSTNHSRD